MRIIAGKYRSSKLITLEGLKTRPTLDRIKEAIFSSLGNYLPADTIVLDLFGGSGALSLESLSRGAKKAYIIDSNPDAIKIIKLNAQKLGIKDELVIMPGEYQTILPKFKNTKQFNLVFIDPPFRLKVIDEIINYLLDNQLLSDASYIVAQYPAEDVVGKDYPTLSVKLCRRYASSEVLILTKE